MPKRKENLLVKIVKKDYSNELEKVFETKDFDEDAKSLLFSIFYKLDVNYKDYKKVKRNVQSKQDYQERLVKIIQNDCNTIKIAKLNSKEGEKIGNKETLVDSKNKKIICYPVERKLLYSISQIGNQSRILKSKYFVVNRTMSNMINIGNNINSVEPLRDFNGWSWLIDKNEIEDINYNLVYQNLRILVGEKFLNSWITTKGSVKDYYEEFRHKLTEKFGKKIAEKLILNLERLSILLEIELNPTYEKTLKQLQIENEERLLEFKNNKQFIENLTEDKKQINNKIKKIEKILSSKNLLEKEYTKINKKLSEEQKILGLKMLENQMVEERQGLLEKLEEKNELLNPKKFIQEKSKLEKTHKILKVLEEKNKDKEKKKILEEIQKIFLQCFLEFINSAETKDEIINLIYILRYYNFLPFDENTNINESYILQEPLKEVKEALLKKAIHNKIMPLMLKEENAKILQWIFESKIISLEEIYISLIKEKDKYYVEFSEDNENSYQEKFEICSIKQEGILVKLNKKIKILS